MISACHDGSDSIPIPPLLINSNITKSSAVFNSIYGNITDPSHQNLILNHGTHIDVYLITSTGLQYQFSHHINGIIIAISTINRSSKNINDNNAIATRDRTLLNEDKRDILFIFTRKNSIIFLTWQKEKGKLITISSVDASDRIYRPIDRNEGPIISTFKEMIAIHQSIGWIKLYRHSNGLIEPSPVMLRIEELQVIAMEFLESSPSLSQDADNSNDHPICSSYQLAIIHQNIEGKRGIKMYEIDWKQPFKLDNLIGGGNRVLSGIKSQILMDNIDNTSDILIRVPFPKGGYLWICDEAVFYNNSKMNKPFLASFKYTKITCYHPIDQDGFRYLLADIFGNIYLLVLVSMNEGSLIQIAWETLGQSVIASSICYLDNRFAFVGSRFGDSRLLKIHANPTSDDGQYLEEVGRMTSIAPIVDFIVKQKDSEEGEMIVACCGAFKEGSLAIIRQGIGLECLFDVSFDLPHYYDRIWVTTMTMKDSIPSSLLIIGNSIETVIIKDYSTVVESIPEATVQVFFPSSSPFNNNIGDGNDNQTAAILVMKDRIMTIGDGKVIYQIESGEITFAVASNDVILLVRNGRNILLFDLKTRSMIIDTSIEVDISSVSLLYIDRSLILIVFGLWNGTVESLLYHKDKLTKLFSISIDASMISSSVFMQIAAEGGEPEGKDNDNDENHIHLYVGLINGELIYYKLVNYKPIIKRHYNIGRVPVKILSTEGSGIIALTEKACIIKRIGSQDKLSISFLNNQRTVIDATLSRDNLVLLTDRGIEINRNIASLSHLDSNSGQKSGNRDKNKEDNNNDDNDNDSNDGSSGHGTASKVHIHKIPMGESIRRITHLSDHKLFACLTVNNSPFSSPQDLLKEKNRIRCFDDRTFEERVRPYALDPKERALCCKTMMTTREHGEKLLLGTAILNEDYDSEEIIMMGTGVGSSGTEGGIGVEEGGRREESDSGRLLTFNIIGDELSLVGQVVFPGAIYDMSMVDNDIITVSCNGSIILCQYYNCDMQWHPIRTVYGMVMGLHQSTHDHHVVIGDMLKSISVLKVNPHLIPDPECLIEVAHDNSPIWTSSVQMLSKSRVMVSDDLGNIFIMEICRDGRYGDSVDRFYIKPIKIFHIGHHINRIRMGNLKLDFLIPSSISTSTSLPSSSLECINDNNDNGNRNDFHFPFLIIFFP